MRVRELIFVAASLFGAMLAAQQAPSPETVTREPQPKTYRFAFFPEDLWDKPGSVTVRATIDTRGKVTTVEVVTSSHEELEPLAIWAMKRETYLPALRDGVPVESSVMLTFTFQKPAVWPPPKVENRGGIFIATGPMVKYTEARPVTSDMWKAIVKAEKERPTDIE